MKQIYKSYFLYFLILVYVSGSIGFVLNPTFFSSFTPFTLLLTCFVFLIHIPIPYKNYLIAFFSIALLGFFIEIIGVKTGLVFGNYSYGNALGYKFFNVPLIISINWAMLICASIAAINSMFTNKIVALSLSALIITLIDLLIEQVAPKLDFWKFQNGLPDIQNSIGWFVFAFGVAYLFYPIISKGNRNVSIIILILQIIFFTSLNLFI